MKIAHKTKFFLTKCYSTSTHRLPENTNYERTLVEALKLSSSHSAPLTHGQHLHAHIIKCGHDTNVFIRNSLINLYIKFGSLQDAESIYNSGYQSDRVSCNIMLAGYVNFGRLNDARQMFDKMSQKNSISFTTMIMGLGRDGHWLEVIHVFKEMRLLGLVPNEVTLASALSSYLGV